jgi:hypothetical protein
VVICKSSTVKTETEAVAVCGVGLESFACAVKVKVPAVVGVPVIAPEEEFRFSPGGRDPEVILQV